MCKNEVRIEEVVKKYYVIYRQVAHVKEEDDIVLEKVGF